MITTSARRVARATPLDASSHEKVFLIGRAAEFALKEHVAGQDPSQRQGRGGDAWTLGQATMEPLEERLRQRLRQRLAGHCRGDQDRVVDGRKGGA